jgi:hypothetical protein
MEQGIIVVPTVKDLAKIVVELIERSSVRFTVEMRADGAWVISFNGGN